MPFQQYPKNCPVCQKGEKFIFIQDHQSKDGSFSLYECNYCGVQFWQPFKGADNQWFDRRLHDQHTVLIEDIKEARSLKPWHNKFFQLNKNFPEGTKILDLGCGTGEFLSEFRKRDYRVEILGVDYSQESNKMIEKDIPVKLMPFNEFFREINYPQFDLVTFFEVIEHLDNPLEFIQNIKKILKPQGRIILSVPSRERMLADWNDWDFPPNHLTRWSERVIENIFKKINFKISNVNYIGGFTIFLQMVTSKSSLGLVKRTKNTLLKTNSNSVSIFYKAVRILARLKSYAFSGVFALILWIIGVITRRKNGNILIELTAEN